MALTATTARACWIPSETPFANAIRALLEAAARQTSTTAHPNHAKTRDAHYVAPVSGSLLLFPSGLLHMVQPNETNKDRYSIAFNTLTHYQGNAYEADREIDPDWMRFDLDDPKVRG